MMTQLTKQIAFFIVLIMPATLNAADSPYRFGVDHCTNQPSMFCALKNNDLSYTIGQCSAHIDARGGLVNGIKLLYYFLGSRQRNSQFLHTYSHWDKQQFQEEAEKITAHLHAQEYSSTELQHQVLTQHHLYQFEGFRNLIKTFPDYETYIHTLRKKVVADKKAGNRWWNQFAKFKDFHFDALIDTLYQQVLNAQRARRKQELEKDRAEQNRLEQERAQYRQNVQSYAPYFRQYAHEHELVIQNHAADAAYAERHDARLRAVEASEQDAYRFTKKTYALSAGAEQILRDSSVSTESFLVCDGSFIQHHIHREMITVLDHAATLQHNHAHDPSLKPVTQTIGHVTHATIESNAAGQMRDTILLANCSWAFLEYGKAIAYGIAQGVALTATGIIQNPMHTVACAVAGEYVIAYHIAAALYNVFDIGITYAIDPNKGHDKWQEYTAPLHQLVAAINNKELTGPQKVQGGARIASCLVAQSVALGSIKRLCTGAQKAAIEFVKNNPLATPDRFAATSDGLLFKVADKAREISEKNNNNIAKGGSTPVFIKNLTNKEVAAVATKLGFKETNYYSHGKAVFKKGNKFITLDVDSHIGGFWKMADSIKNLASKKTRLGTYDQFLNRIGD